MSPLAPLIALNGQGCDRGAWEHIPVLWAGLYRHIGHVLPPQTRATMSSWSRGAWLTSRVASAKATHALRRQAAMVGSINAGIASPFTLISEACSLAGHHTRLLLNICQRVVSLL